MRVHHLNCATMRPPFGKWMTGHGRVLEAGRMVAHVLVIETEAGLVLVDSGFGLDDCRDPARRLGGARALIRPVLDEDECAIRQLARLGFAAGDVRHVVLTHLDLDHAGGLSDFPHAEVHVHRREHAAAVSSSNPFDRARYRRAQLAHGPRWVLHEESGERWNGFECVRGLPGLPPEILLVPLHGHSRGHAGVAIDLGGRWLLHAGDAYFHHGEVKEPERRCPPGLAFFQRAVQVDGAARLGNQDRLRALHAAQGDAIRIFSAHDPAELVDP